MNSSGYQRLLIKGMPFLKGSPPLEGEPFGNLQPEDRITAVGCPNNRGNLTSSHRQQYFNPFVTYCGIYWEHENPVSGQAARHLAFRLPPGGVTRRGGWTLFEPDLPFYALYMILDGEWDEGWLGVQDFHNCNLYTYKAEFTAYDTFKSNQRAGGTRRQQPLGGL